MGKAKVTCNHSIESIDNHTINFVNVYTGEKKSIEGVDTVILLTGKRPNEELFHQLEGRVPELHIIGDASKAPLGALQLEMAIRDGDTVARLL